MSCQHTSGKILTYDASPYRWIERCSCGALFGVGYGSRVRIDGLSSFGDEQPRHILIQLPDKPGMEYDDLLLALERHLGKPEAT